MDSLAQLLTWCNVRSGGRYAVFDSWVGMLTAAVLERLGNDGNIVQLYAGQGPDSSYRQAVNALNLEEDFVRSTVLELPFSRALALLEDPISSAAELPREDVSVRQEDPREFNSIATPQAGECGDQASENGGSEAATKQAKEEERNRRRLRRQEEQRKAADLLRTKSLDGLLVASKQHPTPIVMSLLEFVAPSRPFAVFCTFQEPLVDCYTQLKNAGNAVFLKLSESWLRGHQVVLQFCDSSISVWFWQTPWCRACCVQGRPDI